MERIEIISKSSEGKIRTYDIVEADSIGYTPAGFVLYVEHPGKMDEIIYAVPQGCGVRKTGHGTKWDEVMIHE